MYTLHDLCYIIYKLADAVIRFRSELSVCPLCAITHIGRLVEAYNFIPSSVCHSCLGHPILAHACPLAIYLQCTTTRTVLLITRYLHYTYVVYYYFYIYAFPRHTFPVLYFTCINNMTLYCIHRNIVLFFHLFGNPF